MSIRSRLAKLKAGALKKQRSSREQAAPVDWHAVVVRRERELKTVGEARHTAESRIKAALDVIHEWQRDGESNDYLTRVHRALNPPVSGNSAASA